MTELVALWDFWPSSTMRMESRLLATHEEARARFEGPARNPSDKGRAINCGSMSPFARRWPRRLKGGVEQEALRDKDGGNCPLISEVDFILRLPFSRPHLAETMGRDEIDIDRAKHISCDPEPVANSVLTDLPPAQYH